MAPTPLAASCRVLLVMPLEVGDGLVQVVVERAWSKKQGAAGVERRAGNRARQDARKVSSSVLRIEMRGCRRMTGLGMNWCYLLAHRNIGRTFVYNILVMLTLITAKVVAMRPSGAKTFGAMPQDWKLISKTYKWPGDVGAALYASNYSKNGTISHGLHRSER